MLYLEVLDFVVLDFEELDLEVFDLYKWENLPAWKKSIAFKIKIKWENMQTEEINAVMDKVIRKVEATWAKLRE